MHNLLFALPKPVPASVPEDVLHGWGVPQQSSGLQTRVLPWTTLLYIIKPLKKAQLQSWKVFGA